MTPDRVTRSGETSPQPYDSSPIFFLAEEYQNDGSHQRVAYRFTPLAVDHWQIWRNGQLYLDPGVGFQPVPVLFCGVCSTDLARRFLPYPLPQTIGHEVVVLHNGRPAVVEINASHHARRVESSCRFCQSGLDSQCPERITLGIDRLPGGFAPWLLAPRDAIIPIPHALAPRAATLIEPFAAALQAVDATGPRPGERIAVLGPRRLGALLINALHTWRRSSGVDFTIVGIARHDRLLDLSRKMGADELIDLRTEPPESLQQAFDVVYDTTGSVDGFELALSMARRALHLKSTTGRKTGGLDHLTDLVVDELALLGLGAKAHSLQAALTFSWANETTPRQNRQLYTTPNSAEKLGDDFAKSCRAAGATLNSEELHAAVKQIEDPEALSEALLPRFDLAIASSFAQIDQLIRPIPGRELSLVRPRGAILVSSAALDSAVASEDSGERALAAALARGVAIHSSRCGDFRRAVRLLSDNIEACHRLEQMVTQNFPLERIDEAFIAAADSQKSIKVVVETPQGANLFPVRHNYRNPYPTADVIIEVGDKIVLIERSNPPHGAAIPGGFVDYGESLEEAAIREAKEETGLDVELTELLGIYSHPSRDPRFHTITAVYIGRAEGEPKGGDDAKSAFLVDAQLESLPAKIAFDHKDILNDYLRYRSGKGRPTPEELRRRYQ